MFFFSGTANYPDYLNYGISSTVPISGYPSNGFQSNYNYDENSSNDSDYNFQTVNRPASSGSNGLIFNFGRRSFPQNPTLNPTSSWFLGSRNSNSNSGNMFNRRYNRFSNRRGRNPLLRGRNGFSTRNSGTFNLRQRQVSGNCFDLLA